MWKLFAVTLALALPAAAQTQVALQQPAVATPASAAIRRLVPEVQMVIAAEDHHRHPRLNLGAAEIRILDNGMLAPLTSFHSAAGLPLRIALLLDGSASMEADFAAERQAGLALLRRLQNSDGAQIFTILFAAGEAEGNEANGAGALLAGKPGGQTALYDALIHAAHMLSSNTPARRVLLLLSDGEDNYSRASLAEAIAALQKWNIAVYSVTVHSSRLEFPGDRVLREIATATGGRAYLFSNYRHAGKTFATIENDGRGEYIVGFRPVGRLAEGEFHSVKILAPSTKIRARTGYYVSQESGTGSRESGPEAQ